MNFFSVDEPLTDIKIEPLPGIKDEPLSGIKDEPLKDINDEPLPGTKAENPVSIKCDLCFKRYSTYGSLRKHRKNVHNICYFKKKKNHTCPNCDKTFESKSNYNKHMEIYSNVKYTCNQCEHIYENQWSLARHTKMHNNPEATSCKKCNKILSSKEALKYHMQSFHSEKNEIDKVQRVNQENGVYKCNTCGSSYSSISNVNKHIRKHHKDTLDHSQEVIGKIKCDQCNGSYFKRGNLNRHKKTAHGMKHICKHCNLEFPRKRSLRIHIGVVHNKNGESKKRKVDDCDEDKQITEKSKQRKVNEVVNEISEVYDNNKTKVDNNVDKFNEELLDRKITEDPITINPPISNLNKDLRKHYEDNLDSNGDISQDLIGKVICDERKVDEEKEISERSKSRKVNEVVHEISEAYVKKINKTIDNTCNICGISYSSASNLNKHIRKYRENPLDHSREIIGKIKCDQCKKSYFSRGNLNKHMKIAHGIKHVCKHCNLEFARKSSLRIHITVVHYNNDESENRKVDGDDQILDESKQRKVNEVVNEISEVYDSIKEKVENNVAKSNDELFDQKVIEDPISHDWDLMLLNFLVFMANA